MKNLSEGLLVALLLMGFLMFTYEDSFLDFSGSSNDKNDEQIQQGEHEQDSQFPLDKVSVTVHSVADGDTLTVEFTNGKKEKVRLLLVDTPETVHPTKKEQPFGRDASNYTKRILKKGKKVTLEIGQPERDRYDRLLGYIWVDGVNLNQTLIEKGFARVAYINPPNIKYLADFKAAEKAAKEKKVGIWSIDGYVTEKGFVD